MRVVVLDSEAVSALRDPRHAHHREVLQYVEANRVVRRKDPARRTVVPTTVRVESGWDRSAPAGAVANRLAIADVELTTALGNAAARIRAEHAVALADAHIGAIIQTAAPAAVTVVTSDPRDVATAAGDHPVVIVTL